MNNKKLLGVLAAIVLAVIAGKLTGVDKGIFGATFYQLYNLLGQLFMNALNLVVVPLVAASIVTGAARMGSENSVGKLGGKTIIVFLGTTAIALLIGWFVTAWLQPGSMQKDVTIVDTRVLEIASQAHEGAFGKIEQILLLLVPSNILAVASQGQMLGLIFFSLLFGYFLSKIDGENGKILLSAWQGVFQVMIKITELVMKAMPIGVFGLVAKVAATTGSETFISMGYFVVVVLLGLSLYMLGALNFLLRFVAKVHPLSHMRAMGPALLTGFSTASSAATLPVSLECVEKRSGVSNRISSFVIPLATTINLAGSSLQVIVSVLFISQVYGVHLSFANQAVVFLMAWILSVGVAGIPSGSLISIVIILGSFGFPADGIGLIMAVERGLDMCRTLVNIYSGSCGAVIVAASEGEKLPISIKT